MALHKEKEFGIPLIGLLLRTKGWKDFEHGALRHNKIENHFDNQRKSCTFAKQLRDNCVYSNLITVIQNGN